ncbi:hypothetical protein BS50DRAFT_577742 [Corynespora cassiicola Philippines]|uniref:Uncharacterized protein n=1 Tax=Corynespora cassiicola Philippines TaxID=1448308 RepID=A0A2T2NBN2_CORCC|nr:hypothetical protein BS50DRAFT_577742 [Corynespora cassiicola Philippines]
MTLLLAGCPRRRCLFPQGIPAPSPSHTIQSQPHHFSQQQKHSAQQAQEKTSPLSKPVPSFLHPSFLRSAWRF